MKISVPIFKLILKSNQDSETKLGIVSILGCVKEPSQKGKTGFPLVLLVLLVVLPPKKVKPPNLGNVLNRYPHQTVRKVEKKKKKLPRQAKPLRINKKCN